jgi:hypothetical protein
MADVPGGSMRQKRSIKVARETAPTADAMRSPSRVAVVAALVLVFLIVTVAIARYWLPPRFLSPRAYANASDFISAVEEFRRRHGRYPVEGEMRWPNDVPYRVISGGYEVYLGFGFDDYCAFRSADRQWHCTWRER